MTRVTAVKPHSYRQAKRQPGQDYDADDRDVPILLKLGWVTIGPQRPVVKQPVPEPAAKPAAEEPAEEARAGRRDSKGRFYRRRDLAAEEQPRPEEPREPEPEAEG